MTQFGIKKADGYPPGIFRMTQFGIKKAGGYPPGIF